MNVLLLVFVTSWLVLRSTAEFYWLDGYGHLGFSAGRDIFYDRVVILTRRQELLQGQTANTVIGVFFNSNHVLTSFNPFRRLITSGVGRDYLKVMFLASRDYYQDRRIAFRIGASDLLCARQVIPMNEEKMGPNLWHGTDKMHSPLHDLMVAEVRKGLDFLVPDPSIHKFEYKTKITEPVLYVDAGPIITPIARPGDVLDNNMEFVSIGHYNERHIKSWNMLAIKKYKVEDDVVVDCDEWMPRFWGYFICLRNIDEFIGIGSGALLFVNRVLFGVGSFTVNKDSKSILVFTDIRPYYEAINMTCTISGVL